MTRLFFDHIPRAGGSAFCDSVRATLGPAAVVSGALPGTLSSVLRRYAGLQAICGRVDYGGGDALPEDRFTATLLRDPIERSLSLYASMRHDVIAMGNLQSVVAACRTMTFAECLAALDQPIAAHLRNGQARHLASMRWDGVEPIDDARLLELAVEVLHAFDLVGVQESMPDFIDVAGARLGWGPMPEAAVLRAASHPLALHALDAETVAALQAANEVDLELYRHARQRFERQRRESFRALLTRIGPTDLLPRGEEGKARPEELPAIPRALTDWAASIALSEAVATLEADSVLGIQVEVHNESVELWPQGGERPVRLSYHWLDMEGNVVTFDGERTRLPFDLGPGDSVRIYAAVKTPDEPGRYVLRLGMLQEGVDWFESRGTPGSDVAVDVITRDTRAQ